MILSKVWIKNFRSIKECTLTIGKNLQILVGINEAGKSNILKALTMIDPSSELSKNDIRDPAPDEENVDQSMVRFVFSLTKEELGAVEVKANLKILAKNKDNNILTIGENETNIAGFIKHKAEALYNINLINQTKSTTHWSLIGPKYRILPEWKKVIVGKTQEIDHGKERINISEYSIINIKDFPGVDPSNVEELDINKLNVFLGAYFVEIVNANLPKCIAWSYQDSLLLPGKIDLTTFRAKPDMCLPLKIMFNLAGHDNITKTILDAEARTNGIKNLFNRVSEVTTTHMRKVWPEWNKLKVKITQNGEFIEAGIEDEFNFFSLERRSDGFKRFFTFLLMMSAQNKTNDIMNNLIVIDEPEIGLHPSGQNYLRDELIKISKNNIILISTHSIFMIDKEQIDRHIIVTKTKEVTALATVQSSNIIEEEVVYKALGFSLYEILRAQNIIFEGWRDKNTFDRYLKSKGAFTGEEKKKVLSIGLLHSLGVKDAPRVANMCENFGRKYIIISDADKPGLEKQRDFDGNGDWFTYKDIPGISAITTEDFVSKKSINKAIRDVFKELGIDQSLTIDPALDADYISIIEKHLKTIADLRSEPKIILNAIKDHVVENLKPEELEESYRKVVDFLLEKLQ